MTLTTEPVRVSQLLGAHVFLDGELLGQVRDIRVERPSGSSRNSHELVVTGLLCSRLRYGTAMGYARPDQSAPWILDRLMRWLHRHDRLVRWETIERIVWTPPGADQQSEIHVRVRPDSSW